MSADRMCASFSQSLFPLTLESLEGRVLLSGDPDLWPLPLPDENISDIPVMQPSVVTAGGQRLLLSYFNNNAATDDDVIVSFDSRTNRLLSNKPGWWIINYPLDQIHGLVNINAPASVNNPAGLTDAQIRDLVAQDLFGPGQTADDQRNWYILTPVDADHPLAAEPSEPTGPAPIVATDLSNCYVIVVDNDLSHTNPMTDPWVASRIASATNVVVDSSMFRTIQDALNRVPNAGHYNATTNSVTMKTVILVAPGTYREFVYNNHFNGTAEFPLIFEGIRDAAGNMPVINGATKFVNNSWTLQNVLGDVNVAGESLYRAAIPYTTDNYGNNPAQRVGTIAANDISFIQRSNPAFLDEGEMAYNIGSTEFLKMYGMTESSSWTAKPATGQAAASVATDADGYLVFSDFGGTTNQVVWADTWVWVPQPTGCGYLGDGKALFENKNFTYGPFRAAPHTQRLNDQANPYRMWVNGEAAGQIWNSEGDTEQATVHPDGRSYQPIYSSAENPIEDDWVNLSLNLGWNHIVFQFDTSVAARYEGTARGTNPFYTEAPYWQQDLEFKFTFGGCGFISGLYSQAQQPADLNVAPTNPTLKNYIASYNILGTFAATTPDNAVYVRPTTAQSATRNPNSVTTELANRTAAVASEWNNGHGNYIQLRGFDCRFGGVYLTGAGCVIEGNFFRDSGFTVNNNRDITYQKTTYTYSTAYEDYIDFTSGATLGLVAGDIISLDAVDPAAEPYYWVGEALPAPLLGGHAYFLGANLPGTHKWKVFATEADALAGTNWIELTQATNGSDTLRIARHSTIEAPEVLLNNWSINGTWGDNCAPPTFFDAVNQNVVDALGVQDSPGHARTYFEYNRIVNFNPRGLWYGWDWAAMGKGFGSVQNVYVYNVFDGGTGLGIWLDTDALNCRFDGNLFLNVDAAAINVEASPGPNLIANNIIVSVAGSMGTSIAAWSSNRDWAVNNTLVRGEGYYAAINMNTGENGQRLSPWNDPSIPSDSPTPVWYDHLDARQAYVNNLFLDIVTSTSADTNASTPDLVVGNYTNNAADVKAAPFYTVGQDAAAHYLSDSQMALADPDNNDFRLTAGSWLNNLGASDAQVWVSTVGGVQTYMNVMSLVTHDFYGLLRFASDGTSVGATRSAHTYSGTTIEVEFADGSAQRLEDWQPGTMLSALTFAMPTVSVAATDGQASEMGDTGTFTVTRTGETVLPLLVRYTLSGTAANGFDYSRLTGLITVPAGSLSATVTVAPVDSAFADGETVVLTLTAANDASTVYGLSGNATSTVTLSRGDGMIAWWKLDETFGTTAEDDSGSGLTAAVTGGAAWNVDGYLSGGLTLDGATQFASVADNSAFDFGASSPFTVSAWVKCSGTISGEGSYFPVISHGQAGAYWELALRGNGATTYNGVYLQINDMVLKPSADQSGVFNDNAWHLVTASRDAAGNGRLYIDGALVGTAAGLNVDTTNASELQIGRCGSGYFAGSLDDVRIYGRAISAAESAALADATTVGVAATDNYASTLGNTGTFTVTRTGPTAEALTVYYMISGTGTTNGVSYVRLPGSVTIPAGQSSATVTVQPIDRAIGGDGTVILTLADDSSRQYSLGRPRGSATVELAPDSALIANWTLDSTAGTSAANAGTGGSTFNGTLMNGAAWGDGQLNGGVVLDGVNDYIRVPSSTAMNSALSFGTGGFTLSANVKLAAGDAFSYVDYPILSIGNGGSTQIVVSLTTHGNYEWTLGMNWQTFGAKYSDLCPLPDVSDVFRDHQWHTVTMTRDDQNMLRFYLDGSPLLINLGGGQGRVPSYNILGPGWSVSGVTGDLTIGYDARGHYFKGSIDNVQVYSRALSDSEVRLLADPPMVTVQTNVQAVEPSSPGTFTINTSYATDHDITVYYTVTGTAWAGVDYTPLAGSVMIPAGQTSATISVTPFYDELVEGTETVVVTLSNSADYVIGDYGSETTAATITISDYDFSPLAATDTPTVYVDSGWNYLDVLANDTSRRIPSGTISLVSVGAASHGSVEVIRNQVRYMPAAGYVGSDSFTYTISDSLGGTAVGTVNLLVLDPTEARLKVWLVAQPVVSGEYTVQVWAQIMHGQSGQGICDMSVTLRTPYSTGVTAPKQTPPPLRYVSTVWNPEITANYYTLPSAPFDIDDDGDGDSYQMSMGSSGYTPGIGLEPVLLATQTWMMLTNQFVPMVVDIVPTSRYWNTDGSVRTVYPYFEGVGTLVGITPPTGADDSYALQEDTPTSLDVLTNDTGPGTLRVAAAGPAAHGTVTFTDTVILYTPYDDYYGQDSFTYQVVNESGVTDSATVTLTISNTNDGPTAGTDSATVYVNSLNTLIDVLSNDTWAPDPGPETITLVGLGRASHGLARLVNGLVLYTPSADYVGADSFTYTVRDNLGAVSTGTVNVTVIDPPETRLKVWLVPTATAGGEYDVQIWAQVVHTGTGLGIADLAITIYTPGTVGQTIPKTTGIGGKYTATVWGPDVPPDAFAIKPTASDYDSDTDLDAIQLSIGDTSQSGMGLTPILLATETWRMMSGMPQLAVYVAPNSRYWNAAGEKVVFTTIEAQGALVPLWPRGDVNHDNLVDAADIDAVFANYGDDPQYDLTYDGLVDQSDVDELVREILGTNYGDANLDGLVDFLDFQALLDNWQGVSTWAGADFTGDGTTDFQDFQLILDYWNPTGSAASTQEQDGATQTAGASTAASVTTETTSPSTTVPADADDATAGYETLSAVQVAQPAPAPSQETAPSNSSQRMLSLSDGSSETTGDNEIVDLLSPLYSPVLTA